MNIEDKKTCWRCRTDGGKLGLVNFKVLLAFQTQNYKDSRCGEDFRDRTIKVEDTKTLLRNRTIKIEDTKRLFKSKTFKMKIRRLLLKAELWRFKLRRHFSEGELNIEDKKTSWRCRTESGKLGLVNFKVLLAFQTKNYKDSRCGEDLRDRTIKVEDTKTLLRNRTIKIEITKRLFKSKTFKMKDTKTYFKSRTMKIQVTKTLFRRRVKHWRLKDILEMQNWKW